MTSLVLVLLAATPKPNYDQFGASSAQRELPRLSAAAKARAGIGFASSVEPRLGVPAFWWQELPDLKLNWREAGVTAVEAARRHLFDHRELYRLLPGDFAQAEAFRTFDTGTGAVIVSFHRVVDGVPLYRDALHVVMTHDYRLVALSGWLNPHHASPVAADKTSEPFSLSAATALAVAAQDLAGEWIDPSQATFLPPGRGGWSTLSLTSPRIESARARRVYYGQSDRLVAAWQVEWQWLRTDGQVDLFTHVISAEDGRLLTRLSMRAGADQYRVWADSNAPFAPFDGPQGNDTTPNPTGALNGNQAALVGSALVSVDQAFGSDPWISSFTELSGNNAEAYADVVPPDGYQVPGADGGDLRVAPSSSNTFDYTYDFNQDTNASPSQHQASATQAFFTVNWAHDWLYGAGFDEKAGNAQGMNLGRGGLENDSVKVEVHDWANFNTTAAFVPADGQRPKLELYPYIAGGPSFVYLGDAGEVAGPALFGPQSFQVSAPAVRGYDIDGGYNGCWPLADPAGAAGKIVVYDRASCTYYGAALQAADAGAAGVLITYSQDTVIQLGGPGDFTGVPPTQLLTHDAGSLLQLELDAGTAPPVTMSRLNLPQRDSALDSSLVIHEYGHVMSNRLVGDSNGLINTMGLGMGEGWSDFLALLAMVRAADANVASNGNWKGTYAVGSYAASGVSWSGAGNTAYYLGVRRFPYSTDASKNGLSFRHIQSNETLPMVPSAPFGNNEEPHAVGEVWASTLWDCWVAMVTSAAHSSFDEARETTLKYLIAGMAATPSTPTFLDGRDALLAVVQATNPTDFSLWLGAFAGRGMGLGARAPDRFATDNIPVTEDMNQTGTNLRIIDVSLSDSPDYCDDDGVLDNGETGTLTVTLLNSGTKQLNATTVDLTSTFAGISFPDGPHLTVPPLSSFHSVKVTAKVALVATDVVHFPITVTATDPAQNGGNTKSTTTFQGNTDTAPSFTEKVEASAGDWVRNLVSSQEAGIEFSWFPRDLGSYDPAFVTPDVEFGVDSSIESPPLQVNGHLIITFKHAWSLETFNGNAYDGGLLEISVDNGLTWQVVPASSLSDPYNGVVFSNANSPIAGLGAFVGDSAAYPAWVMETVDLGLGHIGETVKFRFRLVTDISGGAKQWAFDDFNVAGVSMPPFRTWVKDNAQCVNRLPRVNAGPDFTVDEGAVAQLQGVVSDPDGDAFSQNWSQVSGPMVTLSDANAMMPSFTAPEVTQDTQLTFHLSAADGLHSTSSGDDVTVTVKNVNHKPVATATSKGKVTVGDTVTLAGSGTDPDGDTVTLKWAQMQGPTVTLSDDTSASPTFTAPTVSKEDTLTFQLIANDGKLDSDPAMVSVTVAPKGGCGCSSGDGLALAALLLAAQLLRRRKSLS